eukprot:Pgem_evm2s19713
MTTNKNRDGSDGDNDVILTARTNNLDTTFKENTKNNSKEIGGAIITSSINVNNDLELDDYSISIQLDSNVNMLQLLDDLNKDTECEINPIDVIYKEYHKKMGWIFGCCIFSVLILYHAAFLYFAAEYTGPDKTFNPSSALTAIVRKESIDINLEDLEYSDFTPEFIECIAEPGCIPNSFLYSTRLRSFCKDGFCKKIEYILTGFMAALYLN